MKIREILIFGTKYLKENNIEDANLKCKILLKNILQVNNEYLIINDNEELQKNIEDDYNKKLDELIKGKPIQYITGKQEFMGLEFEVNENVLIPQPDTEILVEEAIKISRENKLMKILDICTGSGAIAVSLAKMISYSNITASDISKLALEVAIKNANKHNVKINFILSDMFENIKEKFDLIVSNPPYIEENIINFLPKEVQNEPHIALSGGEDGLKFYRIIARDSKNKLNNNGFLILEIGYNQREVVTNILKNEGYKNIYFKKDFGQNDRLIVAQI